MYLYKIQALDFFIRRMYICYSETYLELGFKYALVTRVNNKSQSNISNAKCNMLLSLDVPARKMAWKIEST